MASTKLVIFVNGKKHVEEHADPRLTLLHHLRNNFLLRGTKEACGVGGCGACTVMLSRYDRHRNKIRHCAVTACLVPLCATHGCAVTTVEGVGSTRTKLHAVQEQLALGHGTQCGFCSPGMVMSMYALLRNDPRPSMADVERALEGNLCRCTGYRPILESMGSFAKDCPMGDACCKNQPGKQEEKTEKLAYDPSQEPIFPSELQLDADLNKSACFRHGDVTWYSPGSVDEALRLMKQMPTAKVMAGNTAVQEKYLESSDMIFVANLTELQYVKQCSTGIEIGAGTTLAQIEEDVQLLAGKAYGHQTKTFDAILSMTKQYATTQLRNLATVGGSVISRKAWSDVTPLFTALSATVNLKSSDGEEALPIFELLKDEVVQGKLVTSVFIPYIEENTVFWWQKATERRCFDTAVVSLASRVDLQGAVVSSARLVVGGLQATPVVLEEVAKLMENRDLTSILDSIATSAVAGDLPSHTADYQQQLVCGLLYKLVQRLISFQQGEDVSERVENHVFTQVYDAVPAEQPETDDVGRPSAHLSALEHTTGEAEYIGDMPDYNGQYHLSLVASTRAHARLVQVDPDEALATPGVVAFLSHSDFPGTNMWCEDEPYFAIDKVTCIGQPIGAIVATDRRTATTAARKVKVTYEDLEPPITSTEEAIKNNSFHVSTDAAITKGDAGAGLERADHVVQGEVSVGSQEHFYMETMVTVAVPRAEKNEMEVYVSAQATYLAQKKISEALGVPLNKIAVIVKRVGGAFGGKQSRFLTLMIPVALAAFKLQRPVRGVLDREEDMVLTGGRHPMLLKYKVGFDKDGKLLSGDKLIYSDGGHTQEHTGGVTGLAVLNCMGCYHYPDHSVSQKCCKTNLPSNTAFRGYGIPQGMFFGEAVMDHVATLLGKPKHVIQRVNLVREGDVVNEGETMGPEGNNLLRCWDECYKTSNFEARVQDVAKYNSVNRHKKRGIAMTPILQRISYWAPEYGQAGSALLQVYAADGSVLLHIEGIEMGQGLYTKCAQVASRVLGIPTNMVHVFGTRTDAIPNGNISGASIGSDLHGAAVKDACEKLMKTLAPYKETRPDGTWQQWVLDAYNNQESLIVTGSVKMGSVEEPNYYTFGAACSEVELDCQTGTHKMLRTDMVVDLGRSLNPAVDIGQIEGAFMMGYGMYMMEERRFDASGRMTTAGADRYKLPTIKDIPLQINVHLLKDSSNTALKALYSSKGVGEPPLLLSISVFMALKHALTAARADREQTGYFRLDAPATPQRVLHVLHQQADSSDICI